MSALLHEDERALRDAVRSFLDKKVAPLVAAHEQARTFPWELLPQLYDFGYVRGGVPEAAGGTGDGFVVNGSKLYITNALGCDFGILFVRVVDSGGTDHGVTGLLVDAAESQFGVHDIPHMPLRSTTSCEPTFDDTLVPAG